MKAHEATLGRDVRFRMRGWALRALILPLALLTLAGCSSGRRTLDRPGVNQAVRVTSGDRLFFELDENPSAGERWDFKCDDSDVEVQIRHAADGAGTPDGIGRAAVTVRIHRGYDGPSVVRFFYGKSRAGKPLRQFALTLFKRTGDCAFWE